MSVRDVIEGRRRWWVECALADEYLPWFPDRSVGCTITDPPYSENLYARTRTNKGSGLRPNGLPVAAGERRTGTPASALALSSRRIGSIDAILDEVAAHFLRITQRWIVAFHDCEIGDRWRLAFGDAYVRTGAWVKSNPMPQISADRPAAGFEPCTIAYAGDGRMRWNGGGRAALWVHSNSQGPERPEHPCPKPLALMDEIIRDFTDPDDLVLDPFCGSGTTGLACIRQGRRFIGIERDPTFAALAAQRISGRWVQSKASQTTIFDMLEKS